MSKKIVIIGCGFAGLFAAEFFARHQKGIEVYVIDKKDTFDFLPMLPDIIGRNISADFLSCPIKNIAEKLRFSFINDEVKSVDLDKSEVYTMEESLVYDYLLISSGSETNFYGNYQIKKHAFKLDSVLDCKRILTALNDENLRTFVISGAGYTGIEIASALREFFNKRSLDKKIIIVEKFGSILGPLPQWMKDYTLANFKKMGVEIILNTVVNNADDTNIFLSDGKIYDKAALIWVAGVKTVDFFEDIKTEKSSQGRIKVDDYLRLRNNCFAAGDSSYVAFQQGYLRMAVQFAVFQGVCAASNIIKHLNGRRMDKYKPVDLGYIIPMANNKSCGKVLGVNVTGFIATMMHFLMCVYRSYSVKNKMGIIKDLLKGGI